MFSPLRVQIAGVGRYLPPRVVTSEEIEAIFNLEPGLAQRTGVNTRRWCTDDTAITMAAASAAEACADAGISPDQLDLIIYASGTPHQAIPDGAHLVQRQMGLGKSGIPCMTVHTTCLSFLSGFDVAASYIGSGRYKHVLVVSSDVASRAFDTADPLSFPLFGDASAAAVLRPTPDGEASQVVASRFSSFGEGADDARISGWGTGLAPESGNAVHTDNTFQMDGPALFLRSHGVLRVFAEELWPGLSRGEGVELVLPHQPSVYLIKGLKRIGFPEEKVVIILHDLGNCVAASIPVALYEGVKSGRLRRGSRAVMMGIGAGMCVGGIVFDY